MTEESYWDSAYKNRDFEHWEPIYPSPELAAQVAAGTFGRDARILDVGCGGGLDAIFLAQCGFSLIGVDISTAALRIAEKRAKKAHVKVDWRTGDVLDLPLGEETVDVVTDRGLFHLMEDDDRPKYSSEVHRVLGPGGRLLIRGASEDSSKDRFNPVTDEAIKKYFSSKFEIAPVVPIPLFSKEGAIDGKIVLLRKVL